MSVTDHPEPKESPSRFFVLMRAEPVAFAGNLL